MEVVGHQTVRQTSNRNALLGFPKYLEERAVVSGLIKQPESTDTSIQDVKDDARCSNSASIWHAYAAIKMLANLHAE
jgi:hypothetical protein